MTRITVCRVCLSADVNMHNINNTQEQEVFEKLTTKKLMENGRPETVCYLCYALLQKCTKMLKLFQNTENVFDQLSCSGIELTEDIISLVKQSNIVNLVSTPVRHIDVLDTPKAGSVETINIKCLPHVTVKEEPKEEVAEVKTEAMDEEYDVFQGIYDDNCIGSDDSSKDRTWHVVTTQKQHSEQGKTNDEKPKKKHKKTSDKEKSYSCEICNRTFKKKHNLEKHTKQHAEEKQYSCNECNVKFTLKNNLERHKAVIHNKTKAYSCGSCGKTFSRSDHFRYHMRSHTKEKPFPCSICNMRFSSTSNVQQHVYSIHSKKKPYVCDQCDKTLNRKGNLQEHYRVHTGHKPYNCDKCDFKSSYLSSLKSHCVQVHRSTES